MKEESPLEEMIKLLVASILIEVISLCLGISSEYFSPVDCIQILRVPRLSPLLLKNEEMKGNYDEFFVLLRCFKRSDFIVLIFKKICINLFYPSIRKIVESHILKIKPIEKEPTLEVDTINSSCK